MGDKLRWFGAYDKEKRVMEKAIGNILILLINVNYFSR